jgi:hypothetical protein
MSEMIERVAQAICGDDNPANILTIHRSRALAAIEAMREPTQAMSDAAAEKPGQMSYTDVWQAMIDAAVS